MQPQTKEPILVSFTVQHFEPKQSAESTRQNKHFNYNSKQNNKGE
jgi:hypothetical protein